jgi:hypothetical protein
MSLQKQMVAIGSIASRSWRARSGECLYARVRPHRCEVVIIYPRYDRLPIDGELNRAGMVKCDFGEHSAAGATLDQQAATQLRVVGELDDGVPV